MLLLLQYTSPIPNGFHFNIVTLFKEKKKFSIERSQAEEIPKKTCLFRTTTSSFKEFLTLQMKIMGRFCICNISSLPQNPYRVSCERLNTSIVIIDLRLVDLKLG
eukprot:TRINITY_DN22924_c2_g1_i1.p2 TRINITY_DN22924_c2_g1~~TRINITY_DN22924_c2_g1_i1.p2  ORF type:complete len:105 (+),score=4.71 TRINITY_DN22924_c2_g1_i1:279-593(+)